MAMPVFSAVHARPGKIDHFIIGKWLAVIGLKELHPGDGAFFV